MFKRFIRLSLKASLFVITLNVFADYPDVIRFWIGRRFS